MNNIKYNIGLIECGTLQKPLYLSPVSVLHGYAVKKVLSTDGTNKTSVKTRYPHAEMVETTREILDDSSIDLVIVSDPSNDDMSVVGEALQAGKQIRII